MRGVDRTLRLAQRELIQRPAEAKQAAATPVQQLARNAHQPRPATLATIEPRRGFGGGHERGVDDVFDVRGVARRSSDELEDRGAMTIVEHAERTDFSTGDRAQGLSVRWSR